ncbi:hypothetical protein GGR79_003489 [Xanthomonas arboricola]|uniref:hypothetical protein n=1 Tax=Xanthomonas arboricola TaxID=56448 RepID=UPI001430C52A|nr:hypothetical protein [Xanthomonas arboricola]NJC31936.1 hypothetical protein [Xanthomonas arboricola]
MKTAILAGSRRPARSGRQQCCGQRHVRTHGDVATAAFAGDARVLHAPSTTDGRFDPVAALAALHGIAA